MKKLRLPLMALGLTLVTPSAWAQVENRIARSASLPFLRLSPRSAPLAPGERQWQLLLTNTNEFRVGPGLIEDAETTTLRPTYRWGTGSGEWSVEVPLHARGGGVFDRWIDWWHLHVIGVRNARSNTDYGLSQVTLPGTGTFGSAAGMGDIVVGYAKPLGGTWFLQTAVKLPTGDPSQLLGSGALDVGASIQARHPLTSRLTLNTQAGFIAQGRTGDVRFARGLVDQWGLALNLAANSRDTWTLQWQSESSALLVGNPLNDAAHRQLTLAYRRQLTPASSVQAFFTEDGDFLNFRVPTLANLAPDFSMGLIVTYRF